MREFTLSFLHLLATRSLVRSASASETVTPCSSRKSAYHPHVSTGSMVARSDDGSTGSAWSAAVVASLSVVTFSFPENVSFVIDEGPVGELLMKIDAQSVCVHSV